MHLALVPPTAEFFDPIWPVISDSIGKACEYSYGMHTLQSTFDRLKAGYCQLWIVIDDEKKITASCTSSFFDFPSGLRALMVELTAGDSPRVWFSLTDEMESWAKENGGHAMLFPVPRAMRTDFVKKHADYRPGRYLMIKELA